MEKIAFYSGLFDPFTRGHLNIIIRTLRKCDRIIIGVENDECTFNASERIKLVQQSLDDLLSYGCSSVQFRDEIIQRIRENPEIIEVVAISGEVVDTAILHHANIMVRGVRNDYDIHLEEEIKDRIKLQFKVRNYPILDYHLEQTNGEVVHMSSTVTKELCRRGEYIAALHHVTPGVHNTLMKYYLRPLFEKLFGPQKKLWHKLCETYLHQNCGNFTHVAYMLNRLAIEKALGRIESRYSSSTVKQAMFLCDICDTPEASARWIIENIHNENVDKIAAAVLDTDYSRVQPKTAEGRIVARCDLLLLTDEENYPLYRRMQRKNAGEGDTACYRGLANPRQYMQINGILSEDETAKIEKIISGIRQ